MALPSGLPEGVGDAEVLARHVFSKHHLVSDERDPAKKWARPQAFLPQLDNGQWLFSVSRTAALPNDEAIQRNGMEVGQKSGRRLKGSALVAASAIREASLKDGSGLSLHHMDVLPDEAPDGSTPYHAHVTGFLPLPAGAEMKEFFKEASEDLARRARELRLVRRTLPTEPWELDG